MQCLDRNKNPKWGKGRLVVVLATRLNRVSGSGRVPPIALQKYHRRRLPSRWESFERLMVCLDFLWDTRSLDVRKEAFDKVVLRVAPSRSVSEPSNKMPRNITISTMTHIVDVLKSVFGVSSDAGDVCSKCTNSASHCGRQSSLSGQPQSTGTFNSPPCRRSLDEFHGGTLAKNLRTLLARCWQAAWRAIDSQRAPCTSLH